MKDKNLHQNKAANKVKNATVLLCLIPGNKCTLLDMCICQSWFLITYHVELTLSVCLTYFICSIPNALFPLISGKQLG